MSASPALYAGPSVIFGAVDPSDWQRSMNAMGQNGAYAQIDAMTGQPMGATHPQLSWAYGYNADGTQKYQEFYPQRLLGDYQSGRISVLTWMSFNLANKNDAAFSNDNILAGNHDAYIIRTAKAAGAYGHKFIVRFDPEMNGTWEGVFSTYDGNGNLANGNSAGSFPKMWSYVRSIFRQYAPNVYFYWCINPVAAKAVVRPNTASVGGYPTGYNNVISFAPPSSDVDYVGCDLYNWGAASGKNEAWMSFDDTLRGGKNGYGDTLAAVQVIYPAHPWIIGEISCNDTAIAGDTTPGAGDKPGWIVDMCNVIPQKYPMIKLLLWFNWNDGSGNWTITPGPVAQAFAKGLSGSAWLKASTFPMPLDSDAAMPHYSVASTPDKDQSLSAIQSQLQQANASVASLQSQVSAAQSQLSQIQQQLQAAQQTDTSDLAQISDLQKQLQAANAAAQTATSAMQQVQSELQSIFSFANQPVQHATEHARFEFEQREESPLQIGPHQRLSNIESASELQS